MADQKGYIYHIHLTPRNESPGRTIEVRADSIEGGDDLSNRPIDSITLKLEGDTVAKFRSYQVSGWSRSKLAN